jgi:hypothetical protein
MMTDGRLRYVKIGTRRLIPKKALVELLASGLPAAEGAADRSEAGPSKPADSRRRSKPAGRNA